MARDRVHVVFHPKELKGSRLRCLMLTSLPREQWTLFGDTAGEEE